MEDRLLEELILKKMEIKDALMELERLKENETVKRYLELLEYDTEENRKFVLKSNDEMIEEIDSGNIYYCLGKGFVGYVQKNGEYHILSHSFNDFRLFAI